MNRFALRAAALLLAAATLPAQSPLHPTPLLTHLPHLADPAAATLPQLEHGVPVALDLHLAYASAPGDLLRLPAFEGAVHDLRVQERKAVPRYPGAFHLICSIEGSADGLAILTVRGDRLAGTIHPLHDGLPSVHLHPAPHGMTCLRQLTVEPNFCNCGQGGVHVHRAESLLGGGGPGGGLFGPQSSSGGSPCADPSVITLMMVADSRTGQDFGGQAGVDVLSLMAVELVTTAFSNGGIPTAVELTSARLTSYHRPNIDTNIQLSDLQIGVQGLGAVDGWRRQDGADLVAMLIHYQESLTAQGQALLPETDQEFVPDYGFSLTVAPLAGTFVFPHEVGHNFGCQHDPSSPQGSKYRSYGQGHVDRYVGAAPFEQRWAMSIMAYNPTCGAINCVYQRPMRFSQDGAEGQDGSYTYQLGSPSHDNVRLIEETRLRVAGYSDTFTANATFTQQPVDASRCEGSQLDPAIFTVAADRADSYRWQKRSGSRWVAIGQTQPTLELVSISASDFGRYRCVVRGCNGADVISSAVNLSQAFAPEITRQPTDVTVDLGVQANPQVMSVAANNAASYQWFEWPGPVSPPVPLAGQNTAALTFQTLDCDDTGFYFCRVTSGCGLAVDSDRALLTVGPLGEWISYGMGCAAQQVSHDVTVYEQFTSFDLRGGSLRFTPDPSRGWTLSISPSTFDTAYANALGLGDDELSRNHALGFAFPLPGMPVGTTTSSIDIDSNGWVGLVSGQHAASQYLEDAGRFLNDPARIAMLWDDLNPSAGGEVYFDVFADRALVTWVDVPRYDDPGTSTFQLQLFPNGEFVLAYESAIAVTDCLVGYSEGGLSSFRAPVDLSEPPTGAPVLTPASLAPTIGRGVGMRVDLSSRATLAVAVLGFLPINVNLTGIGMPGCMQLTTGDVSFPMQMGAQSAELGFVVPDNPQIIGAEFYMQAFVIEPGANAFGMLTSNGLTLRIGACR